MTARTCPKCKSVLGEHDFFFCSSCGFELPKELVKNPESVRTRTLSPKLAKLPTFIPRQHFPLILIFVIVLAFLLFLAKSGVFELLRLKFSKSVSKEISLISRPEEKLVTLNLNMIHGEFGENTFESFAPEKSQYYIEGNDFPNFLKTYGETDFYGMASVLLENDFATFGYKEGETTHFTYITKPKNTEVLNSVLKDLENHNLRFLLIDNFLVISNTEEIEREVQSARSKVRKSLGQNTAYSQLVANLPKEGVFKVVFMDIAGREIVRNFSTVNIESVVSSKFDSFVIK